MKTFFIILFCIISWLSLGAVSGTAMVMTASIDLAIGTYIGAVKGTVIGLLCSPFFILKRTHNNIFEVLVICFIISFPIALISGLTVNPSLAIVLTVLSYMSVYFLLLKNNSSDKSTLFSKKTIYVIPVVCLIIASVVAYNYENKSLPDDIPSLIKMMGDNDIGRHMAAARKLKTYGKEPFLIAIKHKNPNVRARAAHFLGLLNDPSVEATLIEASTDTDSHVRMWVAFSLGEIGDKEALPTLNILVNDKEKIVSNKAQEAIKIIENRNN